MLSELLLHASDIVCLQKKYMLRFSATIMHSSLGTRLPNLKVLLVNNAPPLSVLDVLVNGAGTVIINGTAVPNTLLTTVCTCLSLSAPEMAETTGEVLVNISSTI
jgi:hypothetical protein